MWRCMGDVFAETPHDSDRDLDASVFEPERSLIAVDGEDIVATAGIFSRELTVPGAIVPMAGVTFVAVAPTHRRRGLLTQMITRQLNELHQNQGEAVAALWASESAIYQRFGYGNAAPRAALTGATRETAFRPEVDLGTGRVRRLDEDKVRPHARAVYDALRPQTVGWLDRTDIWWARRHYDPEHWRDGATEQRYLVHEDSDGQVTGWASYRIKGDFGQTGPNGMVQILDLGATTHRRTRCCGGFCSTTTSSAGSAAECVPWMSRCSTLCRTHVRWKPNSATGCGFGWSTLLGRWPLVATAPRSTWSSTSLTLRVPGTPAAGGWPPVLMARSARPPPTLPTCS